MSERDQHDRAIDAVFPEEGPPMMDAPFRTCPGCSDPEWCEETATCGFLRAATTRRPTT